LLKRKKKTQIHYPDQRDTSAEHEPSRNTHPQHPS